MNNEIDIREIEKAIIIVNGERVIIDRDVARLYGVETKRINEAIKNNLNKFPKTYILELSEKQKNELVENFDRFESLKHSSVPVRVFTEKGIYMLATILRSKRAIETTFQIIETFSNIRSLARNIQNISQENEQDKNEILNQSSKLFRDILEDNSVKSKNETTLELNLAILKVKHTFRDK